VPLAAIARAHQTRLGFRIKAYLTLSFGIYIALGARRGRAPSAWDAGFAVLNSLLSLLVRRIYNQRIKRFYEWANPAWETRAAKRRANPGTARTV
jgi:hypothetical protein